MPYSSIGELPKNVAGLPTKAKDMWMKAFNSAFKQYKNETSAFKVAWAAVEKAGYKKKMSDSYFTAISLGEDVEKELEVMRVGKWNHPIYGNMEITDKDLNLFKESFDKNVRRVDIAVDIEHGETPNKGAAAGWFKELRKDAGRLLAKIEWTDLGKENVKSGKYKYFSPEFKFAYQDAETGKSYSNVLLGGGLTNRPFIKGMQPVLLSEDIVEDITNTYRYIKEEDAKVNKELLKVLKLAEDASEDVVNQAINEYVKKFDETSAKNDELTKQLSEQTKKHEDEKKKYDEKILSLDEKVKKLEGDKTDVEKENIKLSERLDNVEKALDEKDWEAIETKALSEGKMTKATAEQYKKLYFSDKEMAKNIISTLQPIIDLSEAGSERGNGEAEKSALVKFDEQVIKTMKEKNIPYTDALVFCEKEHTALFNEMQKERGVR